jgi:AcrR family transcriptional regulator
MPLSDYPESPTVTKCIMAGSTHAAGSSEIAPDRRRLDPERTRQAILDAAHEEFVEKGLDGARVDAIAARTQTVKRMIYYYFGSKEDLFLAVLERAYTDIRTAEAGLDLDRLPPVEAIRRMVEFTFDYHDAHPDFVRLVCIENINYGRFLAGSSTIEGINVTMLDQLRRILERGEADGTFRGGLDPVDVHMMISALAFYRVSNRHTFGTLFGRDMAAPTVRKRHRVFAVEAVLRMIKRDDGEPQTTALGPVPRVRSRQSR